MGIKKINGINYIEGNIPEFTISGIMEYHKQGILGQGVKFVNLENDLDETLYFFNGKVKRLVYNKSLDKLVEESGLNQYKHSHGQKVMDVACQIIPNADKFALTTENEQSGGKISGGIIKTFQFIIDNKIDVVNSSVTGVDHPLINKMIKEAQANGTIFVNASGNSGREINDAFANTDLFIEVGAVYHVDSTKKYNRTNYSSTGKKLEGMGFVPEIHSATDIGYTFTTDGTSFASPYVAGMIGLIKCLFKQKGKFINQDQMLELLNKYAVDMGDKGKDDLHGIGLFVLPPINEIEFNKYGNIEKEESKMKFKDVPESHWAYKYVDEISNLGIMNGKGNNLFCPNDTLTRAEIAKIIVEAIKTLKK